MNAPEHKRNQSAFLKDIKRNERIKQSIAERSQSDSVSFDIYECSFIISIMIENTLIQSHQQKQNSVTVAQEKHIELLEKEIEDMIAAIGEINKA